jgi:hypothetical protein
VNENDVLNVAARGEMSWELADRQIREGIFVERAGAGYVARFNAPGVEMRLRHLKMDRGEARASLTVVGASKTTDATKHLYHGSFNLSGLTSRSTLAKYLKPRWEADWEHILEQLCLRVLSMEEEGEPAVYLRDARAPAEGAQLLSSLALARHPVIWFGDGGSAKSYLALAAGLSIHAGLDLLGIRPGAQKKVAYLDWEFDAWEHKMRMARLLGGKLPDENLPDILYVRCTKPLARESERIAHIFADHDIGYAVVDSISWACEGPPEEASSATGFFEALRSLGVGSLCIAHVNRSGDTERPFGSAFWHNGARATWYVKKQQEHGASAIDIGFFNRKANSDRLEQPFGYSLRFDPDQTRVARVDVKDVPELAGHAPIKDRMVHFLRGGAKTYREIADELGIAEDAVRQTVKRWEGRVFYKLTAGNASRVGLTDGREGP